MRMPRVATTSTCTGHTLVWLSTDRMLAWFHLRGVLRADEEEAVRRATADEERGVK